jgi:carboxylate-amine ligase
MSPVAPLRLFEVTGIEIEYMIVDRDTLSVKAIADELIKAEVGRYESEIEVGDVAWSNELALHLVELKTNGPARRLPGLAGTFQANVAHINRLLAPMGAMLMPSAMHPWMNPDTELALWPHEHSPVYETFDRIFDCRGHGWANLQSTHLNLPFGDDDEFGRLHAAIRVLLPILPALAASSPILDAKATGLLDNRLEVYRHNAAKVPSVCGAVVPEPLFSRAEYERLLLQRIYRDLAPFDPAGTLRHEWVNARGCIARFDRDAIEIRVLDVQECPRADVAIAAAVIAVLQGLTGGDLADLQEQRQWPTERLAAILLDVIRDADATVIADAAYRQLVGYPGTSSCRARDLWQHLLERTLFRGAHTQEWRPALDIILGEGCLARRILTRLGHDAPPETLREVYRDLCVCLAGGVMFHGQG